MKVLVTGGSGFIGTHVAARLKERDIEPVLFDRRYPALSPYSHLELGDVRDWTVVEEAVGYCDGVIHLAGILGTSEAVDEPLPAIETNILGTMNVFKAIRMHGVPAAYITLGNHFMNNTYSITKSTSERFALMANKEWGTRIAVVRAYNAYGPGQKTGPVRKIMPSMLMSALRDEAITVYGEGDQIADMVFVEDVAEALVRSLVDDHGVYDSIMEAGSGVPTTVKEIAETVIKLTGAKHSFVQHVPMRAGEPEGAVVLGDPTTLKPLGMLPEDLVQLEEGIVRTIPYYRNLV